MDEIPYKDLRNYKVKQNYDNQLQYLSTLNIDEVSNQIEQDINDYNNYIDFIISKNNRITNKVKTEYNNLLTKLTADRDYINNVEEDVVIEEDVDRDIEEENDLNTIDSSIFNNQENNFNDDVISTYNEIDNYEKIESINDLLTFTDVEYEITFVNDEDNYDIETGNIKEKVSGKLIMFYKKVDKAIEEYNDLIDKFKNNSNSTNSQNEYELVSVYKFNDVIRKIKKLARRFKYYYYPEININQIYSVYSIHYNGYSDEFNNMLYNDFNDKYQKFKVENKNSKKVFMMFKYYYIWDNYENYHETPIIDNNLLSPENILSGKTVKEVVYNDEGDEAIQCSDSKLYSQTKPMIDSIYSFKFINKYKEIEDEMNKPENIKKRNEERYKEYGIDSNTTTSSEDFDSISDYSFSDEINDLNYNINKNRVNREGQMFTYKINKQAFNDYFGDYSQQVIDELYKYQIFEEFNPNREEYKYNCLLYSIYMWFKINRTNREAEDICNELLQFNLNRLSTLKDIKAINKHFEDNKAIYKQIYKIKNYKLNNINKKVNNNGNKDKVEKIKIPVCLIDWKDINEGSYITNHYILYNNPKFCEDLLKLINKLKSKDSKNNNWKDLTSYTLIRYLLENKDYKFFIPFTNKEISKIINEEDRLVKRTKGKELYQLINEMSNYEISKLQQKAFSKNIKDENKNSMQTNSLNNVVDNVISSKIEYDKLCIYDFEASTKEIGGHKAYMVCYIIVDYPKVVFSKDGLIKYLNNFKMEDIKVLINNDKDDCATKFLEVLPNKTLCYAHNARYDLSFFAYNKIKIINPIEKDGNFYATNFIYKDKFITIKDSYRIISSKLKSFPSMFNLCGIDKNAFPFNFFTDKRIKEYSNKYIKVGTSEWYSFIGGTNLTKYFNGYTEYQRLKNKFNFIKVIKTKCDGVFNVMNYLELYYQNTIVKEVFPYDFYTIDNLKKYDKDYVLDSSKYQEFEKDLIKGFSEPKEEDKKAQYKEFRKVIKYKFNGIFNMYKYSEFYCRRDVEILFKGLLHFRTAANEILKLDCFKELTISGMAQKYMINNVYTKTGDEDLYTTSGVLNQYIQSAVYGGVCATYKNGKALVRQIISDFDKVSLYPSACTRLYVVTGKCQKFDYNEIKNINDSMYDINGNYNNKTCWLLKNIVPDAI